MILNDELVKCRNEKWLKFELITFSEKIINSVLHKRIAYLTILKEKSVCNEGRNSKCEVYLFLTKQTVNVIY
jgi:hypothetical protein